MPLKSHTLDAQERSADYALFGVELCQFNVDCLPQAQSWIKATPSHPRSQQ